MRVSTILNFERISELLVDHYGMTNVCSATEIPGASTGHVWRIKTDSGNEYVLKEFTPTFSLERVSHEPELVMYLHEKGMKVTEFYSTKSGGYTWYSLSLLDGESYSHVFTRGINIHVFWYRNRKRH